MNRKIKDRENIPDIQASDTNRHYDIQAAHQRQAEAGNIHDIQRCGANLRFGWGSGHVPRISKVICLSGISTLELG